MRTQERLAILLVVASVAALFSSEDRADEVGQNIVYRRIPTSEKRLDRDLSFCLTFDGKSVAADLASGDPDSSTFGDGNLEFRTVPGFDGQNAFNRLTDETLHYSVDKNIDHRQGSVVFWIMAQDYDPGSVAVSDPVKTHKPYFYARFANGKEWVTLFFYQYFSSPTANFYQMMWKGAPESGQTVIDDIKIFSRLLTSLEIRRQYVALVESVTAEDLPPFELSIDGVDDGTGLLDRLAVSLDLTPLPAPWLDDLRANTLRMNSTLTFPDDSKRAGVSDLARVKTTEVFDGITQPGEIRLGRWTIWRSTAAQPH